MQQECYKHVLDWVAIGPPADPNFLELILPPPVTWHSMHDKRAVDFTMLGSSTKFVSKHTKPKPNPKPNI